MILSTKFLLPEERIMSGETDKKTFFTVSIKHNEESLTALSHMQYDLFCRKNLVVRTIIAVVCIALGAGNYSEWWGVLLIAYGGYLLTSKYSSSNHAARKLAAQFKAAGEAYPSSEYIFGNNEMRIIALPDKTELEPLPYDKVYRLGEDLNAFYIFQNQYGGYMIKKAHLGDREEEFSEFIKRKTGQNFFNRRSRLIGLRSWLKSKENEPYHL